MKRIFIFLMCFLSASCFAFVADKNASNNFARQCTPVIWPIIDQAQFADQFETAAYCHCSESGMPYDYCKKTLKMRGIFKMMIARYQTIQGACDTQRDIPSALCVEQWGVYCGINPAVCVKP